MTDKLSKVNLEPTDNGRIVSPFHVNISRFWKI